ncbi:hypothetical protein HMI54_003980 [Coelomomyces lativittatus]|nr:hypothetical protein HMI54_003980 [Coelomomyces lativittatus]KAJ1510025.1 hypothetical protein HMI55_007160 [Coelomomyces lativittatus]KAJ1514271.1 hypothetical protein HMI56_000802 [Coelomomyces lativittatus]
MEGSHLPEEFKEHHTPYHFSREELREMNASQRESIRLEKEEGKRGTDETASPKKDLKDTSKPSPTETPQPNIPASV